MKKKKIVVYLIIGALIGTCFAFRSFTTKADGVSEENKQKGEVAYEDTNNEIDKDFTGIIGNGNLSEELYYYENGEVKSDYTGLYEYQDVTYYIENGIVNQKRTTVINYALEQMKAGGKNQDLLVDAYKLIGIDLPYNAREKLRCGRNISQFEVRPGDGIVYQRTANYCEEGIYIGNGKMLLYSSSCTTDGYIFVNIHEEKEYIDHNYVVHQGTGIDFFN